MGFRQNGGTEEQFIAGVLGSGEYFNKVTASSSSPNSAFIQSLYSQLLGRTAGSSEVAFWLAALPMVGRAAVAAGAFRLWVCSTPKNHFFFFCIFPPHPP